MKKLKLMMNLLTTAIITTTLLSCGGNSKEYNLTPEGVKGDMKDYIEIAPGSYKLTVDENKHTLKLTIKLTSKVKTDKEFQEVNNLAMVPLEVQLLDDKGNPPAMGGEMDYDGDSDKLKKLLKDGEENFFSFSKTYEDADLKDANFAKFILNTNATENPKAPASEETVAPVISKDGVDCDKILKDYEVFSDNYIEIVKKYKKNPTDVTMLNEYTQVIQKAIEMKKYTGACDDTEYASKFVELSNKMAQATM